MAIKLPPALQPSAQTRTTNPIPSGTPKTTAPGDAANANPPPLPPDKLQQLLQQNHNQPLNAKVLAVTQASEQQRQQLLQQLQSAGAGHSPSRSGTPAAPQPATKAQLTGLLAAPLLNLVKLEIQGQRLLTFTDQPLRPGASVLLQQGKNGQLLIQLTATRPSQTPASGQPAIGSAPLRNAQTQALLSESLRAALPRQQPHQRLLEGLQKLRQLPPAFQALLPAQVKTAVAQLLEQTRTPTQLAHPYVLKNAIRQSGINLENQLATNTPTHNAAVTISSTKSMTSPPAGAQSGTGKPPATTARPQPGGLSDSALKNLPATDLKAGLLHLSSQLVKASSALTGVQLRGNQQAVATDSATRLLRFLQSLIDTQPQQRLEVDQRDLRQQLIQLLHQQVMASLAKMQMQQLHSLNHQLTDTAPGSQSWVLEIPLKWGEETHSLELRIDEEWVEDKDNKRGNHQKIRQWEVIISFELPTMGNFHAQLKIVNDSVSATLWAEQQHTLQKAKQQLDELRSQLLASGVEVKKLECLPGQPPQKTMQLGYSLVDVRT